MCGGLAGSRDQLKFFEMDFFESDARATMRRFGKRSVGVWLLESSERIENRSQQREN